MDDQPSYESFKKILDSMRLEYNIVRVEDLLYKAVKNLQERINPPQINGSTVENLETTLSTSIELKCKKHGNKFICYEYDIEMLFGKEFLIHKYDIKKEGILFRKIHHIHTNYIKKERIECHSDSQNLPYKIECTKYSDNSSFELFNPRQSKSFIEDTKNPTIDIFYILNPEVKELTYMDKYYTTIKASAFMDLGEPKKNPEINKYGNRFEYYTRRFNVTMTWH